MTRTNLQLVCSSQSTDKAVSLSSLDSGDNITRLKKQDGKGLKQDTLDPGLTQEGMYRAYNFSI